MFTFSLKLYIVDLKNKTIFCHAWKRSCWEINITSSLMSKTEDLCFPMIQWIFCDLACISSLLSTVSLEKKNVKAMRIVIWIHVIFITLPICFPDGFSLPVWPVACSNCKVQCISGVSFCLLPKICTKFLYKSEVIFLTSAGSLWSWKILIPLLCYCDYNCMCVCEDDTIVKILLW